MNFTSSKIHGFNLIEFLLIIVIIGIISVLAIPKWTASSMRVNYEAIRVLNDIRYTQLLSMSTGIRYRWVMTSSTTYQILNSSGTAVILPSGTSTQTLASGVSFGTLTNLPNSLLAFDSQGAPYTTSATPGTTLTATAIIPLTGATTRNVEIAATTGYGVLV